MHVDSRRQAAREPMGRPIRSHQVALSASSRMIKDLWYKNAIVYCLSVGTYMDANAEPALQCREAALPA
jgi:hypothetical protein